VKALSIKHPWMQWTLTGEKRAERRPWNTHYRGPVVLCSSKELDAAAATEDQVTRGWRYGQALAVAELMDVRPMRDEDSALTCCANQQGAFVFIWGKVTPLAEPFPVRGLPGLFDVDHPSLAAYDSSSPREGETARMAPLSQPDATLGAAPEQSPMSPVTGADLKSDNTEA
jgi:hypothetical protein